MQNQSEMKIEMINFKKELSEDFCRLNYEWLEKYFYIEDYDRTVLTNPQEYIIDKGGHIFFAKFGDEILGTVALIKRGEAVFELSKMAVTEKCKGMRIGQKMMYFCINKTAELGAEILFLDSNTKLTPAISLYRKVGFKEIPVPEDTPYDRCNIRMQIKL